MMETKWKSIVLILAIVPIIIVIHLLSTSPPNFIQQPVGMGGQGSSFTAQNDGKIDPSSNRSIPLVEKPSSASTNGHRHAIKQAQQGEKNAPNEVSAAGSNHSIPAAGIDGHSIPAAAAAAGSNNRSIPPLKELPTESTKGHCDTSWSLEMPLSGDESHYWILRDHYTPFCVSQTGAHGMRELVLNSEDRVLEVVQVPMYKGKGCALLSGNYRDTWKGRKLRAIKRLWKNEELTATFDGCRNESVSLQIVDISCSFSTTLQTGIPATCLSSGIHSRVKFQHSLIVLPLEGASISEMTIKIGGSKSVVFTHSSVERKSRKRGISTHPSKRVHSRASKSNALLSLSNVFLQSYQVWFAFGWQTEPSHTSTALLDVTKSNIALQHSVLIGAGEGQCLFRGTESRFQIRNSELYSHGSLAQLELHDSYAVLYRVHSISSSGFSSARPNFVVYGQLSAVLCPIIWMSSVINWSSKSVLLIKSLQNLYVRDSILEQQIPMSQESGLMLTDVFLLSAASMVKIQSGTHPHKEQRADMVRFYYSRSRFKPRLFQAYTVRDFVRNFTSSDDQSHMLTWMARLCTTTDRMSLTSITDSDECPQPTDDSVYRRGSEHTTYTAERGAFRVVVRYSKASKGGIYSKGLAQTFVHPSTAFRICKCTQPSGQIGEVYGMITGKTINRPQSDLDLDTIYNVAFEMLEAFGFVHSGNPYGSTGHGDFAVGYFQNKKIPPRTKNFYVDFESRTVHLIDFDTARVNLTRRQPARGSRKDLLGVGFTLWNLAGIGLTKESLLPENNRQLIQRCSPMLRRYCEVAHQCLDFSRSGLTVNDIYKNLLKSVPEDILFNLNKIPKKRRLSGL